MFNLKSSNISFIKHSTYTVWGSICIKMWEQAASLDSICLHLNHFVYCNSNQFHNQSHQVVWSAPNHFDDQAEVLPCDWLNTIGQKGIENVPVKGFIPTVPLSSLNGLSSQACLASNKAVGETPSLLIICLTLIPHGCSINCHLFH